MIPLILRIPVAVERKISLAAYYNALYAPRGFALAPHHYPLVMGLEDHRIQNLFMLAGPGTGKSNLLDIAYASWEMGHDPTLPILAVSAGEALPQGFMSAVMQIVQHDKTFQRLFPDVRPDPAQGWSISRGLFVTGHPPTDPDASYKAVGISSKALTGLHTRLMILDDIHDRENASTPEARQQVKNTYYDTLMGRADPRGCRRVAAGRWWAPDDIYQEWKVSGDWVVLELPAVRPGNSRLWYDVFVPRGLTCVYSETLAPEPDHLQDSASPYIRYRAYYGAFDPTKRGFYWPASDSKRKEYEMVERRQPRTAAINYRGDMTGGGEGIFKEDDFRVYAAPENLNIGIQDPMVRAWIMSLKGNIEDAWDTAHGQPRSSSMTAALTGLMVPCREWHRGEDETIVGKCDFHYDLWLLDLMLKDLDFGQLSIELRTRFRKWHPRRVNIEEKQTGISLLQTFKGTYIPVMPLKVEQGKVERAINPILAGENGRPIPGGAASVQGWAKMGRILVPAGAEWLYRGPDGTKEMGFISSICAFTGGSKASDTFDALIHLTTRAIMMSQKVVTFGSVPPGDPVPDMIDDTDPRRLMLNAIGDAPEVAAMVDNPLQGMCIAPCHHYGIMNNSEWCNLHLRKINGLTGCEKWVRPFQGKTHVEDYV